MEENIINRTQQTDADAASAQNTEAAQQTSAAYGEADNAQSHYANADEQTAVPAPAQEAAHYVQPAAYTQPRNYQQGQNAVQGMHSGNVYHNNYPGTAQTGGYYGQPQYAYYNGYQQPAAEQKPQKAKKSKEKKAKKGGKSFGFAAAVIAAALVVGLGAGYAGSVLANSFAVTADTTSQSTSGTTLNPNVTTIDTNSAQTASPIDEEKISSKENDVLLTSEELYQKVKNTVVLVYNYQNVQGYSEPVLAGSASGVVFTSDGYIITNAHVVDSAVKMVVVVPDYENEDQTHEYEATIVGSDTATDLAVLKIEREEELDYAVLGNSDNVRVGQEICVLGTPKSLFNSFTKGIVSGLNRASLYDNGYGCSSIQIDAAINSGNSGGGLFDMYGNVVGIIDFKMTSYNSSAQVENIGFAITINEAKPVINDLMTLGYVANRPGIGINGEMLGEYSAFQLGANVRGLYVTYISENKPVAKSGLRIGDIITKINDTDVTSMEDIQKEVSAHKIGDTVELTVYRKNSEMSSKYSKTIVTVELSELTLD